MIGVAYVNAHDSTVLEISFTYLDNKEINCIFKMCCIIYVLFSTKCHFFHNIIFFCWNYMFSWTMHQNLDTNKER